MNSKDLDLSKEREIDLRELEERKELEMELTIEQLKEFESMLPFILGIKITE